MQPEHPQIRGILPWLLWPIVATSPAWGQFADQASLDVPSLETKGIVTGDFDGDGDLDVAYVDQPDARNGGDVYLVENLGGGRPAPARVVLSGETGTEWILAGDMDGDARPDLVFGAKDLPSTVVFDPTQVPPWVVLDDPLARIAIARSDGAGGFTVTYHEVPFQETGLDARLGDIDGDLDLDLILLTTTGLTTMRNDGSGALTHVGDFPRHDPSLVPSAPPGGFLSESSEELFVGDFDGDGLTDAAVHNRGFVLFDPATPPFFQAILLNRVSLHLSDGAGNLAFSSNLDLGAKVKEIVTGDWNRDGVTDFAAVVTGDPLAFDPGSTRVYSNNGPGGGFTSAVFSPDFNPFRIVAADFTGDGIVDLATYGLDGFFTFPFTSGVRQEITISPGDGSGGFLAPIFTVSGESHGLAAGDLDGDGRADLVGIAESAGQRLVRLRLLLSSPRSFPRYPGTGDDLLLATAVGSTPPTSTPPLDAKEASVGEPLTVEVSTPGGTFVGARLFAFTGFVASPSFIVLPRNGLTGLFNFGPFWTIEEISPLSGTGPARLTIPAPNASGATFYLQFGVLSPLAGNGKYATSDVHGIHIR